MLKYPTYGITPANGSLDTDGKLVVVGNFTTYNDNPVGYVARIFV